jgi:hypothetical protein
MNTETNNHCKKWNVWFRESWQKVVGTLREFEMMAEYIGRDELLKRMEERLNNLRKENGNYDAYTDGFEEGCVAVEDAETVDVAPVVRGHWKDSYEIKSFRYTNIPTVQCSECECYFCDIINNHNFMYHYCPNCGARMDG